MITRAVVNIAIDNNDTWADAFQFGETGDTSWSFAGCTFHMDVKASADDTAALFSLTTANSRIVVDDAVTRILHFNAANSDFNTILLPGEYVYDLVMIDGSSIRTTLMGGRLCVYQGVTRS